MTKPAKLYLNLLANPRQTVSFRDFRRLIEAFGFALDRVGGDHHIFRHPALTRKLNVQPRGKDAKPYQVDQFLAIVREEGLTQVQDAQV